MFDIAFIRDQPELDDEGQPILWGRVDLGDYSERFTAPLGLWQRADYERHWLDAARRLLGESDRTAFFTWAYGMWWTMWREGNRVFVHEELMVPERYSGPYDGVVPYHIIGDRVTDCEHEHPISEWEIALDDLRAFVERRAR